MTHETQKPAHYEQEAVETFERLIREFGENKARYAQLAVLLGEIDQ